MRNKNKIKKENSVGFTLIEVLISIAMVAILTGATLQISRFSDTQRNLTIESDRFLFTIREMQSYSLSIPNQTAGRVCGFGIYIQSNTVYRSFYTFSKSASNDACNKCLGYNVLLADGCQKEMMSAGEDLQAKGLKFADSNIAKDIFFSAPYGDVYQNKTALTSAINFQIEKTTNASEKRIVTINKFGKIE